MEDKKIINTTATLSGSQYIGYQGQVSVSLVKNNKVLETHCYHNSGMPKLFEFLAKALGGNKSEYLRPVKIKLFRYSQADMADDSPLSFDWDNAWTMDDEKRPVQVSPYILYNSTPVVRRTVNPNRTSRGTPHAEDYQYEVTFHFTVPAAYIAEDVIHMVGFYPNNAISEKDEVSAYYLFTSEDGRTWDPITISKVSGNFSIFVDWTLIVSNKSN